MDQKQNHMQSQEWPEIKKFFSTHPPFHDSSLSEKKIFIAAFLNMAITKQQCVHLHTCDYLQVSPLPG